MLSGVAWELQSCYATHLLWHLRLRMSLACVMLQFHRLFKPHFCFYSAVFSSLEKHKAAVSMHTHRPSCLLLRLLSSSMNELLDAHRNVSCHQTDRLGLVWGRTVVEQLSSASRLLDERNPWEPLPVQLRAGSACSVAGHRALQTPLTHTQLLRNAQPFKLQGIWDSPWLLEFRCSHLTGLDPS